MSDNMPEGSDVGAENLNLTVRGTVLREKSRIKIKTDSAGSASFYPGAEVAGRYKVERELGRGGMGRVFLATDAKTNIASWSHVVLKILNSDNGDRESLRRRFENEANLLAGLNNDSIARCYDAFMLSDGMPVLVMEYVEGVPLDEYLKSRGGRIDEDECRELLLPVAGALDYAHESGVFHLDVKPQNIMVRKTRRNGAATCLLDFGIAMAKGQTSLGGTYGTGLYMAPECGDARPSAAMDVYSLAVTAYECMTGEVPYPYGWRKNEPVRPVGEETPFSFAVMRGLSEFPQDRPASCMELVDPDLDEIGRQTGQQQTRPRRRKFPPPPVENLRVSRRLAANGSVKLEWDWPDDLETCMWAIVDSPVSKLEDVPEEDRRWISRKAYDGYGGVVVPASPDSDEKRSAVVFGVYVLASADRTFASREPVSVKLASTTISYRMENMATGWRGLLLRLLRKKPMLAIKTSSGGVPEVEVWAEGPRGARRLMTIPAREDGSEHVIEWGLDLREGETARLRMPRGAKGSFRIEHPFASKMNAKGGFL